VLLLRGGIARIVVSGDPGLVTLFGLPLISEADAAILHTESRRRVIHSPGCKLQGARRNCRCISRACDMREVFIGSAALATSVLTRGRLRWNYRAIFPDVYVSKLVAPTLE
jgi:hypothetical protein